MEDMLQAVSEAVFRGKIPTRSNPTQVDNALPGGTVTFHFSPEAHKVRAARVCKIWKQAFDQYMAAELCTLRQDVWQHAVERALLQPNGDGAHLLGLGDGARGLRLPADGEVDMVISQFPPSGSFGAQLTKSSCDITEWRIV